MAKLAIGVDFGGTKVLAGVIDVESGNVLGTGKKRTSAGDGQDELELPGRDRLTVACASEIVRAVHYPAHLRINNEALFPRSKPPIV